MKPRVTWIAMIIAFASYAASSADGVHSAYAPLAWLVGDWESELRHGDEDAAAPTMRFWWADENRSYLGMSGTKPAEGGGLEPEYEGMVVWHPVRQRFVFLNVYRSGGGRVVEDGELEVLGEGRVRLHMSVHYPPGASLPFSDGSKAGPEGHTLEFRRTLSRSGPDGLRGEFRILRGDRWEPPLPDMEVEGGFPWRRVQAASPGEVAPAAVPDTPLAFLSPFIGSWGMDPESEAARRDPERAGDVAFRFEWEHPSGKLLRFVEGVPGGEWDRRVLDNLVTYDPRSGEVVALGFQLRNDFLYQSSFRPADGGYVREYKVTYPPNQEFRDPEDRERGWIRYRDRCRLEAPDRLHCITEQLQGDDWRPWGDPDGYTLVRQ